MVAAIVAGRGGSREETKERVFRNEGGEQVVEAAHRFVGLC
jgi:hypothetical protein